MNEQDRAVAHPPMEAIDRFLRGAAPVDERQQVVHHLLGGRCESCARTIWRGLRFSTHDTYQTSDYDGTLELARSRFRKEALSFEEEIQEASARLPRLLATSPEERLPMLEMEPRSKTWALVQLLLSEARRLLPRNPVEAFELGELAWQVSQKLDLRRYGRRILDLQARACCLLAILHRIRGDFGESEQAFQQAKELLAQGTGDPIERADILLNEAVLYARQGRYDRAFALLDHVARIARRFEDSHLRGKAMITKGVYLSMADRDEVALQLLYGGIELLSPDREPRLLLVAWHNVFFCLSYMGRIPEALEKLPYVRSLHEKFGNRMDLLRLHWVEARIKADRGDLAAAETMFQKVREDFLEAEVGYEAAEVSLELAGLYLRQGKTAEVKELARELYPIFKSCDVHREAVAALIVFQKAVERETVSVQLVAEIEQYLRQARNDPSLRFRPSS